MQYTRPKSKCHFKCRKLTERFSGGSELPVYYDGNSNIWKLENQTAGNSMFHRCDWQLHCPPIMKKSHEKKLTQDFKNKHCCSCHKSSFASRQKPFNIFVWKHFPTLLHALIPDISSLDAYNTQLQKLKRHF